MSKRLLSTACALVLLIAPTACTATPGDDAETEILNPGEPIRVGVSPFMAHAPIMLAEGIDAFTNHGLEVELVELRSPRDSIVSFAHGDLDVWGGAASAGLFNAIATEGNLRIVAARGHIEAGGCPTGAFIVGPSLSGHPAWDTAEALRGARIGGDFNLSIAQIHLDAALAGLGLSTDDVDLVDMDPPARIGALESGQVDAIHAFEPWITRTLGVADGEVWKPMEEVVPGLGQSFVGYGPRLLDEPQLGERFMAAMLDGIDKYREGPTDENLALLDGRIGMERDELERVCWIVVDPHGRVHIDDLMRQQQFALDEGLLDEAVPLDQLWDPSFVEAVTGEDGSITR